MEEEKIATILANLFPPVEGEKLNIFIKERKFVVVNFDLSSNKVRKYFGEITRSKIKFWGKNGFSLSVNIKRIKKFITPIKVGEVDGYSVWTTGDTKVPIILPYQKILEIAQ